MKAFLFFGTIGLLICIIVACSRSRESIPEIVVGGLYASTDEDGNYRISKILAVDNLAVHVRIYKNKFKSLPKDIDSSQLSLGKFNDPDGLGVGHLPLAKEEFWRESPIFIKKEPVREEELKGYKYYLEEMKKNA